MHGQLLFAWSWILLGLLAGAAGGLCFARADWLGGYAAWPRRLVRLGHIAFLGTGLLNLAACWTLGGMPAIASAAWVRAGMVGGAVLMPPCCYVAAWRPGWRHAFALPVVLLTASAGLLVATLARAGWAGEFGP